MTLVTPIEMPSPLPVNSKSFDLVRNQLISPVGSGFIQAIDRTTPAWVASYTTPPLSDDRYADVQSFLDQLEGSMNTFLAFDPRRTVPAAYKSIPGAGLSAPWGSSRVASSDYAASTLYLYNFYPYAQLTAGDYISFQQGNTWFLYRATQSQAADSGGNMTIKVMPRPFPITIVTYLRLFKACCAMKMLGPPKINDSVESLPSYSFSGVQYVERSSTFIPPAIAGVNLTNWSGTITTGGTPQRIMPARFGRKTLILYSKVSAGSSYKLWVTLDGSVPGVDSPGSIPLVAGYGSIVFNFDAPDGPINVLCSQTGVEFTAYDG